jgi:hypothetical protein
MKQKSGKKLSESYRRISDYTDYSENSERSEDSDYSESSEISESSENSDRSDYPESIMVVIKKGGEGILLQKTFPSV